MEPQLIARIEVLELKVERLETLPDRMTALEATVSELATEMRAGFAAVHATIADTRSELRAEIRQGDEETRRYMRVLHEDVLQRLTTLGESLDGTRPRRKRR